MTYVRDLTVAFHQSTSNAVVEDLTPTGSRAFVDKMDYCAYMYPTDIIQNLSWWPVSNGYSITDNICIWICYGLSNTLRPRQNGRHFPDVMFKCIFLRENIWIPIKILLKFVPMGPINNIPALVQIMAWRRPGDKPLSESVMANLLTHICITWPRWVKLCYNLLPHIFRFLYPYASGCLRWHWVSNKIVTVSVQ